MSITTRTRDKVAFPVVYLILAAIVVFGLILGIIRLVLGLGATTNLSDYYPWGLWIAFDFFAVPFSAGAFTLAAVVHIFNQEKYHGIARLAVLAGFLGYLMVILVLLLDIGRWDQFYSVLLPWRWNLHSFMFEVSMSITMYFGVLILELIPIVFKQREWMPAQLIDQLIALIASAGILLSTVHQGSIGAIFLVLSHKLHPLWWTPIMPLLFLISAVFSGLSVAVFVAIVAGRALRKPVPMQLLTGLAKVVAIVQSIYLVLKIGDLLVAGEIGLVFGSGWLSVLFLVEIIIGVILPLIIFASRARESEGNLLTGTICTLVGLALNRSLISWFALRVPAGATYFPHWMEIVIVIAAFAAAILLFSLGVRYLPVFPEHAAEKS